MFIKFARYPTVYFEIVTVDEEVAYEWYVVIRKSSRKIGIISLSVLSHHPAYRSVQGGSLRFDSNLLVVI